MTSKVFRDPEGARPNVLALGAVLAGWPAGMALVAAPAWGLNALGVAVLAIALTWSAYFIHEFAHQAIFRSPAANERWGVAMSWINGSCYARFGDLRHKHMRHHVERADVISFDVRGFLLRAPRALRGAVLALEWLHFPAVEFLMRAFVILQPFRSPGRPGARRRVLAIGAVRLAGFAALGWWSSKALALYALAYALFVVLLRFADCFQHTYDAYPVSGNQPIPQDKLRDRPYEQAHTYSDVVSVDSPVLNMLWLNFGFHNAHHERPTVPWHRLPAYHRSLYPEGCTQVIPVRELLRSFRVNRIRRIMAADYGQVLSAGTRGRADGFLGAVGVSFLTAI
jgi:fatty acid desaturase